MSGVMLKRLSTYSKSYGKCMQALVLSLLPIPFLSHRTNPSPELAMHAGGGQATMPMFNEMSSVAIQKMGSYFTDTTRDYGRMSTAFTQLTEVPLPPSPCNAGGLDADQVPAWSRPNLRHWPRFVRHVSTTPKI
jgi:hypothetical protein